MLGDSQIMATVTATDMERAVDFYRHTLGLALAMQMDDLAIFRTGSTALLVYHRDDPPKAEHTAVSFVVEDVEAVVDGLLARGVRFERYDLPGMAVDERGIHTARDMPGVKSAWLTDPDGNILAIANPVPGLWGE